MTTKRRPPKSPKIDDILSAYWGSLESSHSRRGYRHDWAAFTAQLAVDEIAVVKAQPTDVQRYVTKLRDDGKSKPTRARALSVIRSVYDCLTVNGIVANNPARSVKNLKVDTAPKAPWLDEEAARRLFASIGADEADPWRTRRDRLCLLLFIGLGWRRAEVARVRAEDFQGDHVSWVVKGGRRETAPTPSWLREEIAAWCAFAGITAGALLPRAIDNPEPIPDNVAYEIVKAVAARAGFPPEAVTPHGLRRTLTTLSGLRGVPLRDRQKSLGHVSQSTTERYDKAGGTVAPGESLADIIYGTRS